MHNCLYSVSLSIKDSFVRVHSSSKVYAATCFKIDTRHVLVWVYHKLRVIEITVFKLTIPVIPSKTDRFLIKHAILMQAHHVLC